MASMQRALALLGLFSAVLGLLFVYLWPRSTEIPVKGEPIRVPLTKRTLDWRASELGEFERNIESTCIFPEMKMLFMPEGRIKSEPKFQRPSYHMLAAEGQEFFAVLDVLDGMKEVALYIDFAGRGEFDKIKPLVGVEVSKEKDASTTLFMIGPVIFPQAPGAVDVPLDVTLFCTVYAGARSPIPCMKWMPNSCVSGTFSPPTGGHYTVTFVNTASAHCMNLANVSTWVERRKGEDTGNTLILLSKNGDPAMEAAPLPGIMLINGKYYRIKLAPDGSEAEFQEAVLPMGMLDTQCSAMRLYAKSNQYDASLAPNPDGKWALPAGHYTITHYSLHRSVPMEDRTQNWRLWTWGLMGRESNTMPPVSFKIKPGATTPLNLGEPLQPTYVVRVGKPGEVRIFLGSPIGRGGERYDYRGGGSGSKITILDEKGEKLTEGQFVNVGFGTYYSWEKPADFKGGFRIQTQFTGPFKYQQDETLYKLPKPSAE